MFASLRSHVSAILSPTSVPDASPRRTSQDDALEIATSRVQHNLATRPVDGATLISEIQYKRWSNWDETYRTLEELEAIWQRKQALRCEQRSYEKYRQHKDIKHKLSMPHMFSITHNRQQILRQMERRKQMNRLIWDYELTILKGEVMGTYDIRGEAHSIWAILKKEIEEEDDRENVIRGKLRQLVDADQELTIEWETWNIVLQLFFHEFELEDRLLSQTQINEYLYARLEAPDDIFTIEKARQHIWATLFFRQVTKTVKEWEMSLQQRINYWSTQEMSIENVEQIKWAIVVLKQLAWCRETNALDKPEYVKQYAYKYLPASEDARDIKAREVTDARLVDLRREQRIVPTSL